MHSRYTEHTQALIDGVLNSPGDATPALRHLVEAHAARLSGRVSSQTEQIPEELKRYMTKVALHAYKVTDQDIEALRAAGYSEDAIFELTLSAALGTGMARLELGLKALKGEVYETESH